MCGNSGEGATPVQCMMWGWSDGEGGLGILDLDVLDWVVDGPRANLEMTWPKNAKEHQGESRTHAS